MRFYKSFNFDYERKFAAASRAAPWEMVDAAWYPYVRLDLDRSVTTIVGANESGKSHLLDSIEKTITGERISRSDFCRYSQFFSVTEGERRSPDFGGEFEIADRRDVELAKTILGTETHIGDRFHLFRPNGGNPLLYRSLDDSPMEIIAAPADLAAMLPNVFRLDANLPLPASIPLYALTPGVQRPSGSRRSRRNIIDQVLARTWSNAQEWQVAAPGLFPLVAADPGENGKAARLERQYRLGRDLLFRVARIEASAFVDLAEAIADEREGYVNGIIQKINAALATNLNFPRWWAQDREFQLMVSPREHELVFTIRDRTGTDYSFAERSNGLKYFLSYYVQLLAHSAPATGQQEILLMDEPDAFLSSQGQQDLLRILEEFALPEHGHRHDQVVYVTHSPFLINRNAAHRIRVLDKGVTDEGTRVVKDAARNHYEPLRSSLGAFVAETSFIGGSNLFVEGLADQVLLAGVSAHLLARGTPRSDALDLNTVTIVPAGSASSVPYLVYLARGRDVVRPPCVVLLDSDRSGDDAAKSLRRGGPRNKQILAPEFVIQVGAWAAGAELSVAELVSVAEPEDLIALPVAATAARNYASRALGLSREEAALLTELDIAVKLKDKPGPLFDAVASAFTQQLGEGCHIEKVGFAKEVIAVLTASRFSDAPEPGIDDTESNFALLLAYISQVMRRANRQEEDRRLEDRLNRTIKGFLSDYPSVTTRERGRLLVEEILASLDDSSDGDRVKLACVRLRREFSLDEDLTKPIDRYDEFLEHVRALKYSERLALQDPERSDSDRGQAAPTRAGAAEPDTPGDSVQELNPAGDRSEIVVTPSLTDSTQPGGTTDPRVVKKQSAEDAGQPSLSP
ncbi:hypothetical protein KDL01_34945 [Actinospica durhamensis]|uniref:ATPase AAA-type core domain-containing protein n=1 Tax=Actinospica durhamensis TaxID=1508375 RepID=A0A941EUS6_9ACTN|nr:AAA family ATPase [Actinospica durhamensis]MBR7838517.1 hypothetical protein [Actinospica durhamensis]